MIDDIIGKKQFELHITTFDKDNRIVNDKTKMFINIH